MIHSHLWTNKVYKLLSEYPIRESLVIFAINFIAFSNVLINKGYYYYYYFTTSIEIPSESIKKKKRINTLLDGFCTNSIKKSNRFRRSIKASNFHKEKWFLFSKFQFFFSFSFSISSSLKALCSRNHCMVIF